jgi:hypothetical protein
VFANHLVEDAIMEPAARRVNQRGRAACCGIGFDAWRAPTKRLPSAASASFSCVQNEEWTACRVVHRLKENTCDHMLHIIDQQAYNLFIHDFLSHRLLSKLQHLMVFVEVVGHPLSLLKLAFFRFDRDFCVNPQFLEV